MNDLSQPMRAAWGWLPEGRSLPAASWRGRHIAILALLWLHVPGLLTFALWKGAGLAHGVQECTPVAVVALFASATVVPRRVRSILASLGLMVASATLVHLSGGYVEMHFHFFVMVIVISVYQDWPPFLLAIGFVVLHHGLVGVLDPHGVYNHPGAWSHPWRWAAIHGAFIFAASTASVINWRFQEQARDRSDLLLQSAGEGILGLSTEGEITFVNAAASRMLGWEDAELLRESVHKILHLAGGRAAGHPPNVCRIRLAAGQGRSLAAVEDSFRSKDGSEIPVEYETTPMWDRGRRTGAVITFRDITERKQHEAQLARHALYDELTGLPNRRLFMDRLAQSLTRSVARGERTALLFIDLDRFKVVNDSLGHTAGDALLVELAGRLERSIGPTDMVARLGGDEFAVLVGESADDHAETIELANRLISELQEPFRLAGHDLVAAASIGIALNGPDQPYVTPADALRDSDIAMYHAKAQGGACAVVFEADMNLQASERLELEQDLRTAVERGELRLEYQPEVDLVTGTVVGFEALARWDHPRLGTLPPARFIAIAEETNLIIDIGRWVLDEACRELVAWRGQFDADALVMAVNLSIRQLRQPDLKGEVEAILCKHGLPPACLRLEITETVMMQDPPSTITTLQALKDLGVKLAIDDFGTGYSSLSHLQRFPVETLKIDRSFVAAMDSDEATRSIVHAVTALAQALNLEVTAEGIETAAHLRNVASLSCDRGQGFYFSKPLRPDAVLDLMRTGSRGLDSAEAA